MKRVVVIGGGTGNFVVLNGLKKFPVHITAIVNMIDNGGSTGILREELGTLPPGDLRQCLVALSEANERIINLFNYRFEEGSLAGHSFGNFFLAALDKVCGDYEGVLAEARRILVVKSDVLPVTYDNTHLCVELEDKKIITGQVQVENAGLWKYSKKRLFLSPEPRLNPRIDKAIAEADAIIISPGSLYSSLIPNFLVPGLAQLIRDFSGTVIMVSNLVNSPKETRGYCLSDYLNEFGLIDREVDKILINTQKPRSKILREFFQSNELIIDEPSDKHRIVATDLLWDGPVQDRAGNILKERTFVRHDPVKLGTALANLLTKI